MGTYLRLVGSLAQNLVRRVAEDLADCVAVCKRGVVYKLRSIRLRYDDVGPGGSQDWQILPEQLNQLLESVQNKPWFCELDRKAAQDLVHNGGPGCFLIRPSATTKALTLTLWYHHRPYNILIRQREDGLLALGSKKSQEMTFHSVDEMVRYYEREPLILYSGGELTGRTRLKAPPPGLVRGNTSSTKSNASSSTSHSQLIETSRGKPRTVCPLAIRRTSAGNPSEGFRDLTCSRALSSGNCDVPGTSPMTTRLAVSTPNIGLQMAPKSTGHKRLSCEALMDRVTPSPEDSMNLATMNPRSSLTRSIEVPPPVAKRIPSSLPRPGRAVPSLSVSPVNTSLSDSTCL